MAKAAPSKFGGTAGKGLASFRPVTGNYIGKRVIDSLAKRIRRRALLLVRFDPTSFFNLRQFFYFGRAFGGGVACLQGQFLGNRAVRSELVRGFGQIQRSLRGGREAVVVQAPILGLEAGILGLVSPLAVSLGQYHWRF